ncbi:uncharacterized protein VICG_00876 [Vittaforma corneae ATCC 50505]|uniref:Uncharacterized protein n=1 Tax=Vittaforma corneae (strain ATCC 50505) TaxID=993615 RepID=L2GN32_VITCO|nr:uncharacterized protein VICG_00876 [Vittaforma corneae ATCC 50505]ELA42029.1 hypothetical protein VICG_00876 [Vittaforma corneae ATCC 50505]
MTDKKSKKSNSESNITKESKLKQSSLKASSKLKSKNKKSLLSSDPGFIQYLNKYGTDFAKFVLPQNDPACASSGSKLDDTAIQTLLQESYEDYMKLKARFVNKKDEESNITEIQGISRGAGPDTFKAKVVLEGKKKIHDIVDLNENDYRLPFLLKTWSSG